MKKIPETDTMRRLSLSVKGWKGSGFPEIGFTLSFREYLASNWGRSSSFFNKHTILLIKRLFEGLCTAFMNESHHTQMFSIIICFGWAWWPVMMSSRSCSHELNELTWVTSVPEHEIHLLVQSATWQLNIEGAVYSSSSQTFQANYHTWSNHTIQVSPGLVF